MKIMENLPWQEVTAEKLSFLRAIGVDYLSIHPSPSTWDGEDRSAYWLKMKALAEQHGLRLYNVGTKTWEEIAFASPDRDEKINAWCTMLRNLGEAEIVTLGFTFQPGDYFRTSSTEGRGGARYSSFDYEELLRDEPDRGDLHEKDLRANFRYFLDRVIPVAEEAGVTMALHPDDPPVLEPLGGVARGVSTLDQFSEIFGMNPSPYHAMLFCQGCVEEMGEDVPNAIRRMGVDGKIAYVHFRSIRGVPKRFQEVFVDEGDQDMFEAMKTYKEIGFEGPFMMDHTPTFPNEEQTFWAGRAFAVGYMRALIQAVYR